MSQVRRLDQIPVAEPVTAQDQLPIWQNGRTRATDVGSLGLALSDSTGISGVSARVTALEASTAALPALSQQVAASQADILDRLPAVVAGPRLFGETEDGPRIRRAIEIARLRGCYAVRIEDGATLAMGTGPYGQIGSDPNLRAALLIPNDIAIVSNNAKILLFGTNRDNYCSGIVSKGFGLRVRGITIDYYNRPYFQGVCVSKDINGATFLVDTTVSIPTFPDVQQLAEYEATKKRWFAAVLDIPANTRSGRTLTRMSDGLYRIDFSSDLGALSLVTVGSFYVAKHQVFGQYGFYAEDGGRLDLDDCTVNCSAGMGVGYTRLKSVDIGARFRIEAPTGSALACTADGIHGHNVQQQVSIRAARIANTGDDPISVNSTGNFVFRAAEVAPGIPANTFLIGGRAPARMPTVGETLTATGPTGQVASLGRILAMNVSGGYANTPAITMSQALPAGFVGTADNGGNLNAAWSIYNDLDCGPMTISPALVENCRGTVRLRGRSIRASYFARDLVGYACYASTIFALDAEGPFPSTVTIDVKADAAPYTAAGALGAVAVIAGTSDGVTKAPIGTIKNVTIRADISNTPVGALFTQGVSGLNADITSFNTNFAPWAGTPHVGADLICVNTAGRVKASRTDGSQAGSYFFEASPNIILDAVGYLPMSGSVVPQALPVYSGNGGTQKDDGIYRILYNVTGSAVATFGSGGDPSTYFDNTNIVFRSIGAGVRYGDITSAGLTLTGARLKVPLPSSAAAAESGSLWYDPADSNRVKYKP